MIALQKDSLVIEVNTEFQSSLIVSDGGGSEQRIEKRMEYTHCLWVSLCRVREWGLYLTTPQTSVIVI